MQLSGIYFITNIVTKQVYVGSTNHYKRRSARHISELRNNKHPNIKLQRSFNKYGEESFIIELMEECQVDQLLIREQFWIDTKNCVREGFNIAFNVQRFGIGPKSLEHKAKISQAHKGKPKSEEARLNMSIAQKTRTKTERDIEGAKKRGDILRGRTRTFTEEWKKKISISATGRVLSPELREKGDFARKQGKIAKMKKVSNSLGETFLNVHEAAKAHGIGATYIRACCYGKYKEIRGVVWFYI